MEEDSDEEEPAVQVTAASETEANPTLFVEGLPEEVTSAMLIPLFQQCVPLSTSRVLLANLPLARYPGLSSLELLSTPAGSAFVVFETAVKAGAAKEALDGFVISKGAAIKVGYAKRA